MKASVVEQGPFTASVEREGDLVVQYDGRVKVKFELGDVAFTVYELDGHLLVSFDRTRMAVEPMSLGFRLVPLP